MTKDEFKDLLEESDLDDKQLQEVLYYFDKIEKDPESLKEALHKNNLGIAILKEDDWRVRAALAAKVISESLE